MGLSPDYFQSIERRVLMAVQIEMPKLSLTMSEGTVIHWMKKVGDPVKKGEAVVEVSSDKEVCELDAPEDGVLIDVTAQEGDSVPCHATLAYIGQPGEKVEGDQTSINEQTAKDETLRFEGKPRDRPDQSSNGKDNVKISPVARKMAVAAGLDVQTIVGTGPNGRITKEDVEEAIKGQNQSVVEVKPVKSELIYSGNINEIDKGIAEEKQAERIPVSGIRKVIASRMLESLQQSAQLTHHVKADITDLLGLKKNTEAFVEKRLHGKFSVIDFIARAVVLSLQEHKEMNSLMIDDEIHIFSDVHLGIAVDVENGLVVPVIHQAQSKLLSELSNSIKEIANLAKTKKISSDQMNGSTFTISNLGNYGVEYFTPILNPPEAGILGIGAAQETPVFVGHEIQKRVLLPLSLTFNHQVVDGAPAANFLKTVKDYLEEPINLLLG